MGACILRKGRILCTDMIFMYTPARPAAADAAPAKDIARAYADAGYQGIVITDHFIHGNTAVPENLPWKERMHAYEAACLAAREEGAKRGLDVLFGLEHRFGDGGKEVLVYGILPDVLAAHPGNRIDGNR